MTQHVRMLRSGSLGIVGTLRNAKHHAQNLIPIIDELIENCPSTFAEWAQGHNVHKFTTYDGRQFVLRPVQGESGYAGIMLSLRVSRSKEIPLTTLMADDRKEEGSKLTPRRLCMLLEFLSRTPLPIQTKSEKEGMDTSVSHGN